MLRRTVFLIIAALGAACSMPEATLSPTSAPTPEDTQCPLREDTVCLTTTPTTLPPIRSATPTPSPAPPATATAPVAPLAATGPWLLISTDDGVWVVNPDGSGLTQLVKQKIISPRNLNAAISPDGHYLAYLSAEAQDTYRDLTLNLLTLPEGESQAVVLLVNLEAWPGEAGFSALSAMTEHGSLAWSPDGQQLAFVGMQAGPSSDLYLYSLKDKQITRLTDDPRQVHEPTWSPNGNYIVYIDPFDRDPEGEPLTRVWAARADTGEIKLLYERETSFAEAVVGWPAPDTFLAHGGSVDCGRVPLRLVNVEADTGLLLRDDCLSDFAFDPGSQAVAFTVGSEMAWFTQNKQGGVFAGSLGQGGVQQVSDLPAGQIAWSPAAERFFVAFEDGVRAMTPAGQLTDLPAPIDAIPLLSSQDDYVWVDDDYRLHVLSGSEILPPLFYATPITWSPDGQNLFIIDSQRMLYVARRPDFASVKLADLSRTSRNNSFAWFVSRDT